MDNMRQGKWIEDERHPAGEELLLYLDGELTSREAAQVHMHLEACWCCRTKTVKIEKTIAQFMEFDTAVLTQGLNPTADQWRNFGNRLAKQNVRPGSEPWHARGGAVLRRLLLWIGLSARQTIGLTNPWARIIAIACVTLMVAPLILWMIAALHPDATAHGILSESEAKEKAWLFQPDKVLRWVVETQVRNSSNLPDGHYRAWRWQNNCAGQQAEIIRRYDESGALIWARWIKPDRSEIVFNHLQGDLVTIYPSVAALREFAATLEPNQRAVLEREATDLEAPNASLGARMITNNYRYFLKNGKVEELNTSEAGKIFRIRSSIPGESTIEKDIAAGTLLSIRLMSVFYMPNGTAQFEESRSMFFAETSTEDFDAHNLRPEISVAKRVVTVSPAEVLRLNMGKNDNKH